MLIASHLISLDPSGGTGCGRHIISLLQLRRLPRSELYNQDKAPQLVRG